jgi:hypothetical protein
MPSARQLFKSSGAWSRKVKPKKVGRPKLPKGEAKGRIVPIRFNAADIKRIEALARASQQTVSDWIRSAVAVTMPEAK